MNIVLIYNVKIKVNMKNLLRMSMLLLTLAGCSSENDDDWGPQPQQSLDCKFTKWNLSLQDSSVTTTIDGKTITTCGGIITRIEFNPPISFSYERSFAEYFPITKDNLLQQTRSSNAGYYGYSGSSAYYDQFYKNVKVWGSGLYCSFDKNNNLEKISGSFIPLDDVDVQPTISEVQAKAILRYALLTEWSINVYLFVVAFFVDGKIDARLAYVYETSPTYGPAWIFVDAHTGELLCSTL